MNLSRQKRSKSRAGKIRKAIGRPQCGFLDYYPDDPGEEYSAQKLSELEEKAQQIKSLEEENNE